MNMPEIDLLSPTPTIGWVYEYELPEDLDDHVYDFLYPMSQIIYGVRKFPWPLQFIDQLQDQPNTQRGDV